MEFGKVVFQVNAHRWQQSDFCDDVISDKKVLPPAECTHSVRPAPMQQRARQFLIYSTYIHILLLTRCPRPVTCPACFAPSFSGSFPG